MTGIPQFNFPAFDLASNQLEAAGYAVVSPAEIDDPTTRAACLASETGNLDDIPSTESYGAFLGRDIEIVIDQVDGVVVLEGWEKSRGARIEVFTAVQMSKPVYHRGALVCGLQGAEMSNEEVNEGLGGGIAVPADGFGRRANNETIGDEISGEVRTTSATGGEKGVKPEAMSLIPPKPLLELGRVYGKGAEKYSANNYLKGYEWSKSLSAQLRHLMAFAGGEDYDEETGCHHLMLAAWHSFTLFTYQTEGLGTDDRLFHAIEQSKRGEL